MNIHTYPYISIPAGIYYYIQNGASDIHIQTCMYIHTIDHQKEIIQKAEIDIKISHTKGHLLQNSASSLNRDTLDT